ncbi:MAG: nucleoside-triphosphatase [Eubacteriaceae bacterium]|nr:nucleoside-triphosphatase [Eubacteriaceae bacterium]
MKHLFIEGPVQQGKSTLLRKCLEPYKDRLGGFSSQRLMRAGEIPAAYRITEAGDFCLQRESDLSLPGIFQIRTRDGSEKHPEIFSEFGVELLEAAKDKDLILLDEIGGSELLVPEFRENLYEILGGDVPCIGVIKLNEKARFMSAKAGYPKTVSEMNSRLRKDITERFDGHIISILDMPDRSSNNYAILKKKIEEFLCGIFTTNC